MSKASFISFTAPVVFLASLLIPQTQGMPEVYVRKVYDGDTVTLSDGEKVRLACIDTPELNRPQNEAAMAARDYLRQQVLGKTVNISRITTDRYGRTVAEIYRDGQNMNELMVSSGHASVYQRYAHQCAFSR